MFVVLKLIKKSKITVSLATFAVPVLTAVFLLLFGIGLYTGIISSPMDSQQLQMVRIMYIHVPSSQAALFMYFCVFVCSVMCFITKNAIVRVVASQSAKVGLVMCVLSLVTGALWGKPTWGTYFSLDARMVSMFVMLLIYIGYVAIDDIQQKNPNADKILAIFGIFGAINIPIVKFSTEYWNTLHQPASIIRTGGVSISQEFLIPLAIMFSAMVVLCFLLTLCGTATFFMQKKIERIAMDIYVERLEREKADQASQAAEYAEYGENATNATSATNTANTTNATNATQNQYNPTTVYDPITRSYITRNGAAKASNTTNTAK